MAGHLWIGPCNRYSDCFQDAHHPHDWQLQVDDEQWDWISYMERSGADRGALVCGICDEKWPCETKRAHVEERAAARG